MTALDAWKCPSSTPIVIRWSSATTGASCWRSSRPLKSATAAPRIELVFDTDWLVSFVFWVDFISQLVSILTIYFGLTRYKKYISIDDVERKPSEKSHNNFRAIYRSSNCNGELWVITTASQLRKVELFSWNSVTTLVNSSISLAAILARYSQIKIFSFSGRRTVHIWL